MQVLVQEVAARLPATMMSSVDLTQYSRLLRTPVIPYHYNVTRIYLALGQTLEKNAVAHRQKCVASSYNLQHPVFANFC